MPKIKRPADLKIQCTSFINSKINKSENITIKTTEIVDETVLISGL